jgi:putative component of toxin-antitoxin plasmid stabilization module
MTVAIARMEQGNLSRTKSVGEGVVEYKIDFGAGIPDYSGVTLTPIIL